MALRQVRLENRGEWDAGVKCGGIFILDCLCVYRSVAYSSQCWHKGVQRHVHQRARHGVRISKLCWKPNCKIELQ